MSLEQTTDAVLTLDGEGDYDITFDADGDILTKDFFDTSLLMSVYCERRALESEMPVSHQRRGWIGNEETPDFEIGSKLWLSYQSRKVTDTLNDVKTSLENGLSWLVEDNLLVNIEVTPFFTDKGCSASIDLFRANSKPERKFFELWDNTGQT
jgi:phage gp46-like protein